MKKLGFHCMLVLLLTALVASGCGGRPKVDVSIFMIATTGLTQDTPAKLEQLLKTKLGEKPTVSIASSPIFSMEKLVVEIAAGEHGLIILPEEHFKTLVSQGGIVSLDDLFDAAKYPGGVLEVPADPSKPGSKAEKHLYGVPVSDSKLLQEAGYKGKEKLYAFVHPRAPQMDQAKLVLKTLVEN